MVTAFIGTSKVSSGTSQTVALKLHELRADNALIFDDRDASRLEFDLRGTREEVLARLASSSPSSSLASTGSPAKPGRGRPKLGVTAREVTLLPRHWEWLASQPGGTSVALRKLVENARRNPADHARQSREAAYKFLHAIAGDLPGYEEATRSLFAGDQERFQQLTSPWPADVTDYAHQLAAAAWVDPR